MTACPTHPAAEAVGACARCGRFFCAAEERALDGQRYCGECGQRPDVDWLGAHYAPLIGKRSGFAWATGLIALGLGAVAAIGPLYLAYGRADEGFGRIYFSLGTAF